MRLTVLMLIALPFGAAAHPGHVAEEGGHTHWVAVVALGAAALVVAWAALRRRNKAKGKPKQETPA